MGSRNFKIVKVLQRVVFGTIVDIIIWKYIINELIIGVNMFKGTFS